MLLLFYRLTLCRMSSDEEKSTSPVLPKDSVPDSSLSSDLQDEYEEPLHYTVVTPKFAQDLSKWTEPASELRPADRSARATNDASHSKTPVLTSVRQSFEANMEQAILSEAISSQGSTHGPREVSETIMTELTLQDEKLNQIENILDLWTGSLKTNILTELRNWKLSLIQHHKLQMKQEKEKHAAHVKQLCNEMENLKELLHTYEISIARKDEEYANRIADKQFQTTLMKKVWAAWRSLSEEKWKDKVARACQLRAEDVCVQLTNDYEAKIAELTANLERTKAEILRLHSERDQYEDTMKKAFMRGVCALNLEAMTMFQGKDSRPDPDIGSRRNDNGTTVAGRLPPSQYNPPSPPPPPATTLQLEGMFSSHLSHASTSQTRLDSDSPVIITSTATGSGVTSTQKLPMAKVITSAQQKAGRTITARITGRADMGQKSRTCGSLAVMGVAPPMSSVIVEKHHPVTQQTVSQATAAKYPRTVLHSSGSTTARPAGQAGRMLQGQTHTSVQSIKVVD
ncbi:centrosomal protein POC5 isoform X4 [Myiozetetes cayanensis]|uniref:centrosomal protein POC5 isoform X4 n=1 Tax=Myiozetetes cayanensis TaxID=478635 RepID=UPI00215E54B5|nr:centrosomal protein POC5 isoform X4 [Myiozetetes cayanensis]